MSTDTSAAKFSAHDESLPPSGRLMRFVAGLIQTGGIGVVLAVAAIVTGFIYSLYDVAVSQRERELAAARGEDATDDGLNPPIYDLALDSHTGELYQRDFRGAVSRLTPATLGDGPVVTRLFEGLRCDQLRMSPTNHDLALAFREGPLLLHDPAGNRPDRVIATNRRAIVNYLAFSGDGTLLAGGTSEGDVCLYDLTSDLPQMQLLQHPEKQIVSLAFSGSDVLFISTDCEVHEWKLEHRLGAAPQYIRLLDQIHRAREMVVTADRRFLITGGLNGVLQCWNLVEDRMQWDLPSISPTCRGLAISPDGRQVTASRNYNLLELFDIETGALAATLRTTMQFVNSSVFSEDGSVLFSACTKGKIHFWSPREQIQLGSLAPESFRR